MEVATTQTMIANKNYTPLKQKKKKRRNRGGQYNPNKPARENLMPSAFKLSEMGQPDKCLQCELLPEACCGVPTLCKIRAMIIDEELNKGNDIPTEQELHRLSKKRLKILTSEEILKIRKTSVAGWYSKRKD